MPLMATDPELRAQGYTYEDEKRYEAHMDAALDEHDLELATGLIRCESCGQMSVVVTPVHTGYDPSETYECIDRSCAHFDFAG